MLIFKRLRLLTALLGCLLSTVVFGMQMTPGTTFTGNSGTTYSSGLGQQEVGSADVRLALINGWLPAASAVPPTVAQLPDPAKIPTSANVVIQLTSDQGLVYDSGSAWTPVGSGGASGDTTPATLQNKTIDGGQNTLTNVPASALVGAISLAGITGQWSVANGGTGVATLTGVPWGNGTSPMSGATGAQIATEFSGAHNSASYYLATDGTQQLITTGGGNDVQVFTTSGTATWTKPAGTPKTIRVIVGGGGAGGGGGAHVASGTAVAGGGGGGPGGWKEGFFPAADVGATETVTVGVGGAGGAASSGAGGNNGVAGGTSSFGSWLSCFGGGFGAGTTAASNSGAGGAGSCAQVGANASGSTGGSAAPGETNSAGGATLGAVGVNGVNVNGPTGGAGGGGASTTPTPLAGGNSGRNAYGTGVSGGAATGAVGTAGTTPTTWSPGVGGGGGGAGNAVNGGTGGAGGRSAGGGGGGGSVANNGGAGGKGGDGIVVVITSY